MIAQFAKCSHVPHSIYFFMSFFKRIYTSTSALSIALNRIEEKNKGQRL